MVAGPFKARTIASIGSCVALATPEVDPALKGWATVNRRYATHKARRPLKAALLPRVIEKFLFVGSKLNCVSSNRGDKTAIELFVAGVGVWEARLQLLVGRLADGK